MAASHTLNFRSLIHIFAAAVIFFTPAISSYAAPLNGSSFRRADLLKISDQLRPHFKTLSDSMRKKGSDIPANDITAMEELAKYGFQENAYAIYYRIAYEIFAVEPQKHSPSIVDAGSDALLELVSSGDSFLMAQLNALIVNLKAKEYDPSNQAIANQNIGKLTTLAQYILEKNPEPELPSLNDLLRGNYITRERAMNSLQEFSKILNARIKGQPEVIMALEALEWENQFLTQENEAPDIIYLMGLPGTGKDTTAEAFTDALHGKNGASAEHMFRMPILRERPDLWQVLGSATGYLGSENFPPFLNFLVQHSGGRYLLVEGDRNGFKVVENPEWKGTDLPNFESPKHAVVFLNEFHNWSKDIKDVLIKQALEKGIFAINNPNGGLAEIKVPVRFIVASNEGIGLITSRESNGQRFGKPLNYQEMEKKWKMAQTDKRRLKAEIMAGNGAARDPMSKGTGVSEELLDRIHERFILLMRPIPPESLLEITRIELDKIAKEFALETPLNPGVNITFDPTLAEFIQKYDYVAENNARPISAKVRSLIKETLIHFFRDGKWNSQGPVTMDVKAISNDDGTTSLELTVFSENGKPEIFMQEIAFTKKDQEVAPISDERIDALSKLSETIKKRVFGVEHIADRIGERVISLANEAANTKDGPRNASSLVLMGLSSTGKTELAKAITEALTGDERNSLVIDFSQVQTLHEFKARLLGLRDAYGNPIPSDFMMHYDRNDGDIVVVMDELANVKDPDLLKSLYDFFREPVVTTFSDGKERVMTQVKIIVTGNSGIELYENVPRNIPMERQMAAWEKISKDLADDYEVQRSVLERKFPEPLINRWGKNNIFFVPPHNYKSLKQLAFLKLKNMIKGLRPQSGRRGWELGFSSEKDLDAFINRLVERAFTLREQGASIDSFIKDDIMAPLHAKLLMNKIPSGSKVLIKKEGKGFKIYSNSSNYSEVLKTMNEMGEERNTLFDEKREKALAKNEQTLTAYHEVGHALTTYLLMDGLQAPMLTTIIPGVTKFGTKWVSYAGMASSTASDTANITREYIIRRIAILVAGETAERLVTKGEVHSAGKENDMERATAMAERAVLVFGLSEAWGTEAVPTGMKLNEFVSRFSEEKKKLFETEVKKFIDAGRAMARHVLLSNMDDVVIPMAKYLAEQGEINSKQMAPFFAKSKLTSEKPVIRVKANQTITGLDLRDGTFLDDRFLPNSVADVEKIVNKRKQDQFDKVQIPEGFSFFAEEEFKTKSCASLLTGS